MWPRQLPSPSILASSRPISKNLSRRYSARCCSPKGLAGIEQMRMCSSVIASAMTSKKSTAFATSRDISKSRMVWEGEIFRVEGIFRRVDLSFRSLRLGSWAFGLCWRKLRDPRPKTLQQFPYLFFLQHGGRSLCVFVDAIHTIIVCFKPPLLKPVDHIGLAAHWSNLNHLFQPKLTRW